MPVQPDRMAKGEEALFKLRVTELDNNSCVLAVTCLHLVADGEPGWPATHRQPSTCVHAAQSSGHSSSLHALGFVSSLQHVCFGVHIPGPNSKNSPWPLFLFDTVGRPAVLLGPGGLVYGRLRVAALDHTG